MPKYQTELFGQIIYGSEISYDGLLELEDEMKIFITAAVDSAGGEFISFESEGDRTFFQCAFQLCPPDIMNELLESFKGKMSKNIESKLMFVERMLYEHHFYAINHKNVQKQKIELPESGPIDAALRKENA